MAIVSSNINFVKKYVVLTFNARLGSVMRPMKSVDLVLRRLYSSQVRKSPVLKLPRKKMPLVNEIEKHISSTPGYADMRDIPPKFLNILSNLPESLICIDTETASLMAAAVKNNISTGKLTGVPILEMASGLGVLSLKLLENGATNLRLYEPNVKLNNRLQELVDYDPSKVKLFPHDLHNLGKILYLDQVAHLQEFEVVMEGIRPKKPPALTCAVVGACPHKKFIKLIPVMMLCDIGFPRYGQTELFIAMHPYDYIRITSGPKSDYYKYRYSSVAFQLFFDIKLIEKLDRRAFLPWEKKYVAGKFDKQSEMFMCDEDKLYFVHLKPKKLIYEFTELERKQLLYFLKFHMMRRVAKVIPLLQQWIPECKDRLIALGITPRTCIGELHPEEILTLFRNFISWPEFPHCAFNTSMDMSYLMSNIDKFDSIVRTNTTPENTRSPSEFD